GASNSSFLNAAPPSWEVNFTSLDQASARWQLESHGVLVSRLKLPSPAQAERDLLSALQGVKPGFVLMQTGRAVPVPVVAPKDEQGMAMPRPAGQAVYASRPLRIAGPLRSASLLLPNTHAMAWQQASLTLNPSASAGLTSSKLNLSLQGLMYEISDSNDSGPGAAVCAGLDGDRCAGP